MRAPARRLCGRAGHGSASASRRGRSVGAVAARAWTVAFIVASPCAAARAADDVEKLYWTQNWPHRIQRSNIDGSEVEDVLVNLIYPQGLTVDPVNRKLYWSSSDRMADYIHRANLDGSQMENIVEGPLSWGLQVDHEAGKLYWTDRGPDRDKLSRANLDGSEVEDLVLDISGPSGLALDLRRGHMYWANTDEGGGHSHSKVPQNTSKVRRSRLDGSHVEDIVGGLNYPTGLSLDEVNGKLYWSDAGAFKIQRSNLDGSDVEDVIREGIKDPYCVLVDSRRELIWWSQVGTVYDQVGARSTSAVAQIQRARYDGTNKEDIVTYGYQKIFSFALGPGGPVRSQSAEL